MVWRRWSPPHPARGGVGGGVLFEERDMHYDTSRVTASCTFILDEGSTTKQTDMRVYSPHELLSIFRQVGFVDVVSLDRETDQPVTEKTRLQMVFGRKPRARGGSRRDGKNLH